MSLDTDVRVELTSAERTTLGTLAVLGALDVAAGATLAPDRMWASLLLVSYYAVGVGLAGLCFVAIHYTTGATWSVAIRRVAEALAGTLPFASILLVAVLIARPQLYSWTVAGGLGPVADSATVFKRFWLSRPFFVYRAVAYVATWIVFAFAIRWCSRRQDGDGDARWTRANVRLSAGFLVVFGLTFTLASVDWVMSLEPLWYSTIFGIYNFAGLFLSGLAAIVLLALWLERKGPLRNVLSDDHLHDLGKLLFAFSVFWMYIWFSQYMLIWYTNIPEETAYFVRRVHGVWLVLFLVNLALNGIVPFAVLLRRDMKRHRTAMWRVAVAVLFGRGLDVYLMIVPGVAGGALRGGLWEIGLALGGIGCFGLLLVRILRGAPIVPLADPQLAESLQYEQ